MTVSSSSSILQMSLAAYQSPDTTKPWIVVNALGNPGDEAYIETTCFNTARELAHHLSSTSYPILTIQCFTVVEGRWVLRRVNEVLIGTLGEAAVAVFRDDQGIDFCPDAPEQPVSQVSDLILCCVAGGAQPADRPHRAESYGKMLYKAVQHELRQRDAQSGLASETATHQ